MPSPSPLTERAKPLLGTIVRIRVGGLAPDSAHEAISAAFSIVSEIHHLMSFQRPDSELSLLNASAWRAPIRVTPHTRAVLGKALELARVSDGLFDPTVAPALVGRGLLPCPAGEPPENTASWKDIALAEDGSVSFARPLWLDFGGIAKGYAVDCAIAHLETCDPAGIYVEAGGDLRVAGPEAELVHLAAPRHAALKIENAAIASSGSLPAEDEEGARVGAHIDTRTGQFCPADRFVSVVAPRCIEADALTKVVMAAGAEAAPVLARYGAQAYLCEDSAWTRIGNAA